MNDAPKGGAPPKEVAAAQVSGPGQRRDFGSGSDSQQITTTVPHAQAPSLDRQRLFELALAVMPRGELRRHLPRYPEWCKRIGSDVWFQLMLDHELDPTEIQLLLDAHDRATARRKHECEVAAKERELRALARHYMRGGR
jgi:hypothetical protein